MYITAQGPPVSEMTYTVSSGTLNPSIPYHADVRSDVCDLTYIDMTWVESVLDLSRHVEIDLARFRPGFRHEKLRACREQVADPV